MAFFLSSRSSGWEHVALRREFHESARRLMRFLTPHLICVKVA
jgi:hypothetical protein